MMTENQLSKTENEPENEDWKSINQLRINDWTKTPTKN
jgi:hypothetical protein